MSIVFDPFAALSVMVLAACMFVHAVEATINHAVARIICPILLLIS